MAGGKQHDDLPPRLRAPGEMLARARMTEQPEASSTGETKGESWWQWRINGLVYLPRNLANDDCGSPRGRCVRR